jgi:glycerate 2-kinase
VTLREQARSIWAAAVDAVRPEVLLPTAVSAYEELRAAAAAAPRLLVVGAGKAGAAMSAALEEVFAPHMAKMTGIVNVPADTVRMLRRIELHAARPAGSNHPTADGVAGAERMLELVADAGPDDVAICLLSGGGSALLPAPAAGVTLAEKQAVTKLLHACGATIHEMNAVRKHLSRIKGGRLAQSFAGRALFSLVISDVVGDPLDVIASGPTAADLSTFADAMYVLDKYRLTEHVPSAVTDRLRRGAAGEIEETLKELPANVRNLVLGNNDVALKAAAERAASLGYRVLNLGSFIEGETREVAVVAAGIVRAIRAQRSPVAPPACVLIGGETTVTLGDSSGKGGRNQEFVLSLLTKLGAAGMKDVAILSGGTDGEDGPTDAAGAVADAETLGTIARRGLDLMSALAKHDAYPLFDVCGALLRTGSTNTNVMDVRVILVA